MEREDPITKLLAFAWQKTNDMCGSETLLCYLDQLNHVQRENNGNFDFLSCATSVLHCLSECCPKGESLLLKKSEKGKLTIGKLGPAMNINKLKQQGATNSA